MRWSDPADQLLRRSVAAGHTFARICGIFAEELDVHLGRNAVIGRAFRLGLTVRRLPKPKKARLPRKPRPVVEPPAAPAVAVKPVSFMRLQAHHCRYPNENGSMFCGAPKAEGSSYCEAHHRICYVGSTWRA